MGIDPSKYMAMHKSENKTLSETSIALICSGLGNQSRGFETFFENLSTKIKNLFNVTLIKGGGKSSAKEINLPHIKRDSWILGGPGSKISWGKRYKLEQFSFFIPLSFHLLLNKYDIVQVSDPELAICLDSFKRVFKRKFKVVFTNAFPVEANFYKSRFDLIQQVSKYYYDDSLSKGVGEGKMKLIPYATDGSRFSPPTQEQKITLRKKYDIPNDKMVILSVGSMDFSFKRMDYLIREISSLKNDAFLLIAGQENQETKVVKDLGRNLLGRNVKFATVKSTDMHEIYKTADIFALCSLKEGFGMVFIEAMSSGLPVIAHNHPNMSWILGNCAKLMDLGKIGELKAGILELTQQRQMLENLSRNARKRAVENFSWDSVINQYKAMYENLT